MSAYYDFFGKAVSFSAGPNSFLPQASAGGTLVGTNANDRMADIAGGSILIGGSGDDSYHISDTSTKIVELAGGGRDTAYLYHNFTVPTQVENVVVMNANLTGIANDGGMVMTARADRVTLVGGKGDDVMIDEGNDRAVFAVGAGSGHDSIYGFTATGDKHDYIRIGGYGLDDFGDLAGKMTQVGADVRIDLDADNAVLIRNTALSTLSADNFLFELDKSHLKVTFNEDFNALSLYDAKTDTGIWKTSFEFGPSSGDQSLWSRTLPWNGEKQIYVDPDYAGTSAASTKPLGLDPFSIRDGVLTITGTKTPAQDLGALSGYQYTSGMLSTYESFAQQYGYFEMRADLSAVNGSFPAFWLLPASNVWPPEIDIMENVGDGYVTGGTVNTNGNNAFYTYTGDIEEGFHTYGLKWTAETLTWYVDGIAVGDQKTPDNMHQPMYMIANLAIGGEWAGSPDSDFVSTDFKIDYIRAYSIEDAMHADGGSALGGAGGSSNATTSSSAGSVSAPNLIQSLVSYVLPAAVKQLQLTGTADVDGTGNALDNLITGNNGKNVIDGHEGADRMIGGSGDDIYYVDTVGDVVVEFAGEGTDEIRTTLNTYSLAGTEVENLTYLGTGTFTGTGSAANNVITGGAGNDILDGGAGADRLIGGLGNDIYHVDSVGDVVVELAGGGSDEVRTSLNTYSLAGTEIENLTFTGVGAFTGTGSAADNILTGGDGADWMAGGDGADLLDGGAGADSLYGGAGKDRLFGGEGNDILDGNEGDDTLDGGAGNDMLYGALGNDSLYGGDGNDRLDGGMGADRMEGGAGDDAYYVDTVGDVVIEAANAGSDTVYASISYALTANVERLILTGTANIDGVGNELGDYIEGNAGSNILTGGAGNDTLKGSAGDDQLLGGAGNDWLSGGDGNDLVDGGDGNDSLYGGVGNDMLKGAAGNDILDGNEGNDILDGGAGDDYMTGGLGDDIYYVDSLKDMIVERPGEGSDLVYSSTNYTLGANVEKLTLLGTANLNGTGNGFDNTIKGNSGNNVLNGGAGNDVIIGGAGSDTLTGGAGQDMFVFRPGDFADAKGNVDLVTDFSRTDGDKLDLAGLRLNGSSPLHFIGGDAFGHHAGEIRAVAIGGHYDVSIDLNGDGAADTHFLVVARQGSLIASDFLL